MNETQHPTQIKKDREQALAAERRNILGLSPEKALEAIADHPLPVTLVQSFAEEDFYLLVHTIGPEDALPLLALASNEQWEYLLDMEAWSRDRMDAPAMTTWLQRLLKADADRFTHWIVHQKRDDFEYYLYRNIEVQIREYDQDPSEFGKDFFSEDQTHYIRLHKYTSKTENEKKFQEERETFITDLLKRISILDYPQYRDMLLESAAIIPAEAEEALLRFRNVRLAEKGFLPFDEAVGVYQPLSAADLLKRSRKPEVFSGRQLDTHPLPAHPRHAPEDANLFTRTLNQIQDEPALRRLQAEFAGLCNQVIAADQQKIREKAALNQAVQKVGDYISIGLEKVSTDGPADKPYQHANLIQDFLLADIFRVGYACALQVKWGADRWRHTSWFTNAGLPLGFWGETWMGVLGGLLLKKPLFYDNYKTGVLYREFDSLADIQNTDNTLKAIIAFDDLLSLMTIEFGQRGAYGFLTYQNLLLTLWANNYLSPTNDGRSLRPLTMDEFHSFFKELWQTDTPPRKIRDAMKENFLAWLARCSGLETYEITERMGPALESLFSDIQTELGSVEIRHLDPRYIHLFLIQADA